jgi:hypothetical protein
MNRKEATQSILAAKQQKGVNLSRNHAGLRHDRQGAHSREFGDGIMSAIDFTMDIERVPVCTVTRNEKFCPLIIKHIILRQVASGISRGTFELRMIILCKPRGTLNPCGARTHACSADTRVVARTSVTALLMSRVNIPPEILSFPKRTRASAANLFVFNIRRQKVFHRTQGTQGRASWPRFSFDRRGRPRIKRYTDLAAVSPAVDC